MDRAARRINELAPVVIVIADLVAVVILYAQCAEEGDHFAVSSI
jgi:hypothetical protein